MAWYDARVPEWLTPASIQGRQNENARTGLAIAQTAMDVQKTQMDQAMQPLRQRVYENQIANAALDMKSKLLAQETEILQKRGAVDLSSVLTEIAQDPEGFTKRENMARVAAVGKANPSIVDTPFYRDAFGFFDKAITQHRLERSLDVREKTDAEKLALGWEGLRTKLTLGTAANETRERVAGISADASRDNTLLRTASAEEIAKQHVAAANYRADLNAAVRLAVADSDNATKEAIEKMRADSRWELVQAKAIVDSANDRTIASQFSGLKQKALEKWRMRVDAGDPNADKQFDADMADALKQLGLPPRVPYTAPKPPAASTNAPTQFMWNPTTKRAEPVK